MISAELNTAIPLQVVIADGRTDLFVRATILSTTGSTLGTLPMPHRAKGMYSDVFTFNTAGFFDIVYEVFNDSGFASPAIALYPNGFDQVDVGTIKSSLARVLALHHENTVFDTQTYDSGGRLLTGSLKAYDSKAHADTNDGSTGLLFTWSVTATYDILGQPTLFKIGRLT